MTQYKFVDATRDHFEMFPLCEGFSFIRIFSTKNVGYVFGISILSSSLFQFLSWTPVIEIKIPSPSFLSNKWDKFMRLMLSDVSAQL